MTTGLQSDRRASRLLVLALLIVFLGLLATAAYTYVAYRRAATELVMERDRQLTHLSAAHLQTELSKFGQALLSVAHKEDLRSDLPEVRQAALRREAPRLDDFDAGVALLDPSGQVIATLPTMAGALGQDWSRRDIFRRIAATLSIEYDNALPAPDGTGYVVSIGVPVLGEAGEFSGVLLGMFRLGEATGSSFYASILRLKLDRTGNQYVVDGRDVILYDTNTVFVGHSFSGEVMPALHLFESSGMVRRRSANGRDVLVSYASIPGTPWMLVAEEEWRTLTNPTRPYANLLLGALGLGTLIPAAAVGVLLRQQNREGLARTRARQHEEIAHEMQAALTPEEIPLLLGWEIAVHRSRERPSGRVLDDHLLLPDGRLMISLLHVTETGIQGVLSMISARATLRGAAQCGLTPQEALQRVNDLLCLDNPDRRPSYALMGLLDPRRGVFAFAGVGVEAPLRLPGTLPPSAPVYDGGLGIHAHPRIMAGEVSVPPGSSLLLCIAPREGPSLGGAPTAPPPPPLVIETDAAESSKALSELLLAAGALGLLAPCAPLLMLLKREDGDSRASAGSTP